MCCRRLCPVHAQSIYLERADLHIPVSTVAIGIRRPLRPMLRRLGCCPARFLLGPLPSLRFGGSHGLSLHSNRHAVLQAWRPSSRSFNESFLFNPYFRPSSPKTRVGSSMVLSTYYTT